MANNQKKGRDLAGMIMPFPSSISKCHFSSLPHSQTPVFPLLANADTVRMLCRHHSQLPLRVLEMRRHHSASSILDRGGLWLAHCALLLSWMVLLLFSCVSSAPCSSQITDAHPDELSVELLRFVLRKYEHLSFSPSGNMKPPVATICNITIPLILPKTYSNNSHLLHLCLDSYRKQGSDPNSPLSLKTLKCYHF